MKKISLILIFIFGVIISVSAQKYKSHVVVKGETVYSLAKKYNTTTEAIYEINLNAKDGIKVGTVLAIPFAENKEDDQEYNTHVVSEGDTVYNLTKKYGITAEQLYTLNPGAREGIKLGDALKISKIENVADQGTLIKEDKPEEKAVLRFRNHKVKRKETLYSIAKRYKITIDDIKKFNKELYSREIRKRDKLKIPMFDTSVKVGEGTLGSNSTLSTYTTHTIQAKETKFGIARKHGITVQQLRELNPDLGDDFPIGKEIKVPSAVFVEYGDIVEPGFELYEIQPKETMFGLVRRLDISTDSLVAMNPYIKDGLKAGMVITIPNQSRQDSLAIDFAEGKAINLERKLFNFKPKKIAVMLPFSLDKVNFSESENVELRLKSNRTLRVALDFYSGVLIAVDSAKTRGITTVLNTYDTQKNRNAKKVKELISKDNFDELDAVIGPLFQENVETAASELKKYDVPVFSPLSKRESKLYANFFQTRASDEMLQDKLISFVERDSLNQKNIIIISDTKNEKVKNKLLSKFPEAKVAKLSKGKNGSFLYEINLVKALDKKKPNWVFLESNDASIISSATTYLSSRADSHKVTLFTTDKNENFDSDDVNYEHLSKLQLHYPSIDKEYNVSKSNFIKKYKKRYGIVPNEFAVRGFDITYDILMRLGTADDLYHAATFEGTTEYVENKFNYAKKSLGGYYNKASYLIKFDKDLKLKVVE